MRALVCTMFVSFKFTYIYKCCDLRVGRMCRNPPKKNGSAYISSTTLALHRFAFLCSLKYNGNSSYGLSEKNILICVFVYIFIYIMCVYIDKRIVLKYLALVALIERAY